MTLTVGKLNEILNTLDSDVPIVIENAYNEQFYVRENDVTVEEICEYTGDCVTPYETIVIYTGNY